MALSSSGGRYNSQSSSRYHRRISSSSSFRSRNFWSKPNLARALVLVLARLARAEVGQDDQADGVRVLLQLLLAPDPVEQLHRLEGEGETGVGQLHIIGSGPPDGIVVGQDDQAVYRHTEAVIAAVVVGVDSPLEVLHRV